MKPFNFLSIFLGSIITICLLIVFENLLGMLYVIPDNQLVLDHNLLLSKINHLPVSFYVLVICCNNFACGLGGIIPVLIGDEQIKRSACIGIIVCLFSLLNAFISPFPIWYKIVTVLGVIPFCLSGAIANKWFFDIKLNQNHE